jgi:hypothetical protein
LRNDEGERIVAGRRIYSVKDQEQGDQDQERRKMNKKDGCVKIVIVSSSSGKR